MNNNILNHETKIFSERKLDWPVIQSEMKNYNYFLSCLS